ncbi:protein transporter tim10 [Lobosporangium transversale]|uniref:Mitochondrial import inner membrane translocase subunit n=1 Tax=Lobosporangium transversale TaxID=64571 RepID=A0A1Y2GSP7_9FUNG|nr:mitochondrial import inner membrane translocase subunit tim10 [Lobosporangium transversale]KAF9915256.1 protein transporter tim10 [Lobosporangium transversale]ORZ21812.1 mitochondrial import inner membrane translocase subunit tim10 [Lobosporangium transversale]|eukprot:XP_021883063.1 mitochondrial import inner membrane translocase subunit tim10 [Lobosporangium transversale]
MSFFMNSAANQTVNMQNMAMAEQELEMVSDLFNRIVSSCHQKCIPKTYIEGDLNKGEAVCIDRCVSKFFEVNKSVGTKLQQMSGAGLPM